MKQSADVGAPGYGTALPDTVVALGISAGAMSLLVIGVWAVVAFRRVGATDSGFDLHHMPGPSLVALANKSLRREQAFHGSHDDDDDDEGSALLSPPSTRMVV